MQKFDAVVVGGGPGGYACAIRLSQNGLKTALVEEGELGGTCLNRGCIPTKTLLHSADVYYDATHGGDFGVTAGNVTFDYAKIIERKNAVSKQLSNGIAFLEKWMRKPVALPLSLFAPVTAAFSDTSQSNLFADIRYAIRSLEEGTGEQNAFLCIGFLKSQGLAPLLLVPVQIDTKNLTVSLSATPPIENIPLRVKNKETLKFPVAKNFVIGGTFQIRNYFDAVQEAIAPFPEWRSTSRGLFIGFYDSASLYAFNDMESESWKQFDLTGHLLSQLLSSEGFHVVESDLDSSNPNDIFNPTEHFFTHILDSEANTALLESLSPANDLCVVETPPGSSGEEFLANYISESVSTGKKVLLTYKRKTSFARFEKTWNPQRPEYKDTTLEKAREALSQARAAVVNYDKAINQPIPIGGCSLADALAALAQNTSRKKNWSDSTFSGSENLSKEQFHLVLPY